jgi:hypothetical protein
MPSGIAQGETPPLFVIGPVRRWSTRQLWRSAELLHRRPPVRRGRAPHGRRASTDRSDQPDRREGAVSADGETEIRTGGDNEPDRLTSMRLRAACLRVTTPSRKVPAGAAAVGSPTIFGATFWALQNNRSHTAAPSELYMTDHRNVAHGLAGLPRDYAGVPRQAPPLGPPLPGDLGRPMLNAQNAPSAGTAAIDSEQQRLDQK